MCAEIGDLRRPLVLLLTTLVACAHSAAADNFFDTYRRAETAYSRKQYAEGERLALQAAEDAKQALPLVRSNVINAFLLAGQIASDRRDDVKAEAYFKEATSLTDQVLDPDEWAAAQHAIAFSFIRRGYYMQAADTLRQVILVRTERLGAEHHDTLASRNNLATALISQKQYAEAEVELLAILKIRERILGQEHYDTLSCRNNLASALSGQRKYVEAEAEHRALIEIRLRVLGDGHLQTLDSRNNLAVTLMSQDKNEEAEKELREVIELRKRALGSAHPDTLISLHNLALCLKKQSKFEEARAFAWTAFEGRRKALGTDHPLTRQSEGLYNQLSPKG